MTRLPYSLVLALAFAATPLQAAGLPDTGQVTCYNDTTAVAVPVLSHRVVLRPDAAARGLTGANLVRELLASVPVPAGR